MNCKNCSSPIDSNSNFCSNCGSKQDSQLTPATEQQTKKRSKLVPTLIGIVVIAAVVGVSFFLYQQQSQAKLEAAEAEVAAKILAQAATEFAAEAEFNRRSIEVDNYFKEAIEVCRNSIINNISLRITSQSPQEYLETNFIFSSDSLLIEGRGDDDLDSRFVYRYKKGATVDDISCVLFAIEVPINVIGLLSATTSLQGIVDESWNALDGNAEIFAKWTYHPDPGLNFSIKIKSVYQESFDFETHYKLVQSALDN